MNEGTELESPPTPVKPKKGLARLSPERRKEIAQMGGRRAHQLGRAHRWNSDSASNASLRGWANRRKQEKDGSV